MGKWLEDALGGGVSSEVTSNVAPGAATALLGSDVGRASADTEAGRSVFNTSSLTADALSGAGAAVGAGGDFSSLTPVADTGGAAAADVATPAADTSIATDTAPVDTSGLSMLTATGPGDITGIDPSTAQMLGVDAGGAAPVASMGDTTGTVLDPVLSEDPSMLDAMSPSGTLSTGGTDSSGGIMNWLKNPKNLATAGLLGVSGFNALSKPKLPGAARTALDAAGPAVKQATMTINTGGQGSPLWAGMKSQIDASVDQQIAQETAAIKQAAANSGEQGPGVPTGVTAQQIASMTSKLNVERQQMYEQALNQIVSQAVQELSGANAVLTAIANEQLALDQEARQSAAETAQLAIMLQRLPG